jgi:hypothetical protein
MTTNTTPAIPPSRLDPRQVVNTLKRTINFNDVDVAAALFANSLPLGANILDVQVEIVTVFNAGSTNVLTVGTNSTSFNDIVNAADVNEAATGVTKVTRGLGRSLAAAAEKPVAAKYAQTGTPATTGQAIVTISYEGGWAS